MKSRLPLPFGRRINRDKAITFTFEGRTYSGFEGDCVASALAANEQYLLSRSFKYHRARGAVTLAGQDANTLVQVPGNPNAFADTHFISANLNVQAVNVSGKLASDRGRWLGKLARFLPVGFYYRAFFKPRGAWEFWVKFIRKMAGLGVIDSSFVAPRHDKQYLHTDVAVIGAGAAGLQAALSAAAADIDVLLIDDQLELGGALNYARFDIEDKIAQQKLHAMVEEVSVHDRIRVMRGTVCNGWFSDNWLGLVQGNCLFKVRATEIILATGVIEQPAIFHNNDLPGVMMSSAVQRYLRLYGVVPGENAVVLSANQEGLAAALDLMEVGVAVRAVIDMRTNPPEDTWRQALRERGVRLVDHATVYSATANSAQTHLASVNVRAIVGEGVCAGQGEEIDCDLLCVAVGYMPAYQLACQAGAQLNYRDESALFSIESIPQTMQIAGAVNGRWSLATAIADGHYSGGVAADRLRRRATNVRAPNRDDIGLNHPWPIFAHPDGKEFVDLDEDLQINDLINATKDGYADIQLVKRYSTCGMGPSQGRQSALAAARIVAKANGKTVAQTGVTTARPPFAAERLAHSGGRSLYPARRTGLHYCHQELQAKFMQAGTWYRPAWYHDSNNAGASTQQLINAEVQHVRNCVGMIDVSTLGGIDIRGPDAAELIQRVYTFNFLKQPVGRARYALMTDQAGVVIDDGIACRLADDYFYLTATTTGVDNVYRALLKWNAQWRLDVDIANVTSAYCAINLAGPDARRVLSELETDIGFSHSDFGYMEVRQGHLVGIPVRVLRVGFIGELGYEIHAPQMYAETLWEALMRAGKSYSIKPFGVEAQRVMRLEKGHIIIGQDTDAMSNPHEVAMSWAVAKTKPFFVGGRSLEELESSGIKRKLIGFQMDAPTAADDPQVPKENQLVLDGKKMIGRITSCVLSPTLGKVIGLAYVPANFSASTIELKLSSENVATARVCDVPFYDAAGMRQEEVT